LQGGAQPKIIALQLDSGIALFNSRHLIHPQTNLFSYSTPLKHSSCERSVASRMPESHRKKIASEKLISLCRSSAMPKMEVLSRYGPGQKLW
jgi:hypothetical protein